MTPFTIQCTTCRRTLRVIDPEAIGQILSCPKCGSMVLVQPPAESAPSGYSAAVASEAMSNPAVKVAAATVTESPQALNSQAAGSVEDASEAAPASSASAVRKMMSTEVPTVVSAVGPAEAPANGLAAPMVALAIAERLSEEEEHAAAAKANQWPHWFLPGVLLALAAGFLIFTVRMMAPSRESSPVKAPESNTTPTVAAPVEHPAPTPKVAKSSAEPEKKQQPVTQSTAAPRRRKLSRNKYRRHPRRKANHSKKACRKRQVNHLRQANRSQWCKPRLKRTQ